MDQIEANFAIADALLMIIEAIPALEDNVELRQKLEKLSDANASLIRHLRAQIKYDGEAN